MFENFSFSEVPRLVQTGFSGDGLSGLLVGIDRQFRDGVTTRDIGRYAPLRVFPCRDRDVSPTPYYEAGSTFS